MTSSVVAMGIDGSTLRNDGFAKQEQTKRARVRSALLGLHGRFTIKYDQNEEVCEQNHTHSEIVILERGTWELRVQVHVFEKDIENVIYISYDLSTNCDFGYSRTRDTWV